MPIKTRFIAIGGCVLAVAVFVGLTFWWNGQLNALNQKIAILSKKEATISSTPTFPLSYYQGIVGIVLRDEIAADEFANNGIETPVNYIGLMFAANDECVVPFDNEIVNEYNMCMNITTSISKYDYIESLDISCLSQAVAQSIENGACGN